MGTCGKKWIKTLHFFRIKEIVLNKAKKNEITSKQDNFETKIPLSTSNLV